MAISARWRMPPENSCGYCFMRRSASGSPASSRARTTSASPCGLSLALSVSRTCAPMVHTGLRFDMGSCGTMPICEPRSASSRLADGCVMSSPSKRICPEDTRPFEASSPMAASAEVDLPEPDSPTIATVSPRITRMSESATAWTSPVPVLKVMPTPFISSSGVCPCWRCPEASEPALRISWALRLTIRPVRVSGSCPGAQGPWVSARCFPPPSGWGLFAEVLTWSSPWGRGRRAASRPS